MRSQISRRGASTGLSLALRSGLCAGSLLFQPLFAELSRKSFVIAAESAEVALETFSEQAGAQVIYLISDVRGVRTNAIKGDLPIREALQRLVVGTGLRVVQEEKTGAFVIKRDADPAPPPAKPKHPAKTTPPP